jgi:hypothetical protein
MLAIQRQLARHSGGPKYFSKVMTMPNGVEALVYFEIIERNGHLIAKAIYAEAIDASTIPEQKVCALGGACIVSTVTPVKSYFQSVLTPYFKDFSFVMSQPTRAPSF